MIDRITHDNHSIEGAIARIEQTFLYFKIENKIMTIFSVLAIIFMPPTLITGLFGMNVNVPFQTFGEDVDLNDKSLWYMLTVHNGPFFSITIISILMSVSLLLGFHKMNLL